MYVCTNIKPEWKQNVLGVSGFSDAINVYGAKCKYHVSRSATMRVKFCKANEFWEGLVF